MSASSFKPGDMVLVSWMGATVKAVVVEEVRSYKGRFFSTPVYRLEIPGVTARPQYRADEMGRA